MKSGDIQSFFSSAFQAFLGDPHSCTCSQFLKDRDLCKHICWLLLKKFRVPQTNPGKRCTIIILSFGTYRSEQTAINPDQTVDQTAPEGQSNQDLHCLHSALGHITAC